MESAKESRVLLTECMKRGKEESDGKRFSNINNWSDKYCICQQRYGLIYPVQQRCYLGTRANILKNAGNQQREYESI